jgi:hypothetical protein
MDTGQKTESPANLVEDIDRGSVVLPEFQRDFVWDIEKTFDLFDSFTKDIFVGSLIYGVPTFEITARELDNRPRSGKGSRRKLALKSYTRAEIERLVKTVGFRLLLDGQQRATSIYRALKGFDTIYAVLIAEDELTPEVRRTPIGRRTLEQTVLELRGDAPPGHVCVLLADAYKFLRGEMAREREKVKPFLASSSVGITNEEAALASPLFEAYLTQAKNLENLFRQEKLLAYYLLDTDEEKFALFFERSNSKGIQLNFIDILAAKLYVGFNLRAEVDRFVEQNPALPLNREALVRGISYVVSGGKDTGRAYILSKLTHVHFTEHWESFTSLYKRCYEYLYRNRLVIHQGWMPYDTMILPLMLFLRHIPHHDFSQLSAEQSQILHTWYWLSILSRRYSSAAQTYILEDAQTLEKVAQGDFSGVPALMQRLQTTVKSPEDLLAVHKQYDAVYRGILNFINYAGGGLVSWDSGDVLSMDSMEDHHVFPRDYLQRTFKAGETDAEKLSDCVVNRTLIPKLTNIKVSNKAPAEYLSELQKKNEKLADALNRHLIPQELMHGDYDDLYEVFLEDRAKIVIRALEQTVFAARDKWLRKETQITRS